ncbi:MAG TPA: TolC family protein, partial [Candidatus Acidoferrales bacterium]|nr:TolC family protein [Candidatus Acidoferrales bacterium]
RKAAENQLLPSVNLVGGVGLNGTAGTSKSVSLSGATLTPPPRVEGDYGRSLNLMTDGRFYNYTIGASVEVPISNSSAKADYATANVNMAQSQLALQKEQEQVTLEIKTAVSNLQSDLRSIDATRIARQLAEENVRNQKARYDVGLATTKDLLDYADRLTRAQFAEVQALTQYNSDLAEMRRVEGSLLTARNIVLERVKAEEAPWWATF